MLDRHFQNYHQTESLIILNNAILYDLQHRFKYVNILNDFSHGFLVQLQVYICIRLLSYGDVTKVLQYPYHEFKV